MVKENRLFVGNPGTGKSTLINCLLGEKRFNAGLSWAVGLTKGYERFVKDDIAYMDTPGLADQAILEQAAQSITAALKQGGAYKLFFMVRIENGRVVSEDIVTLERVLDSIDPKEEFGLPELDYKYTVIMNTLGAAQYETLTQRGDEFKKIKTLVNRKHCTESFCFVPRIPALEEGDSIVALPAPFCDGVNNAPVIQIHEHQVHDINVAGLAQEAKEILVELERLRTEHALLLKEIKAQEKRHEEAMRREQARHEAEIKGITGGRGHQGVQAYPPHAVPATPVVIFDVGRIRVAVRCAQFIFSLIATSLFFTAFDNSSSGDRREAITFSVAVTCLTMVHSLLYMVAVDVFRLVPSMRARLGLAVDAFMALLLFVTWVLLAASYMTSCDARAMSLHCNNVVAGTVFVFLALVGYVCSSLFTVRSIRSPSTSGRGPNAYVDASTPRRSDPDPSAKV